MINFGQTMINFGLPARAGVREADRLRNSTPLRIPRFEAEPEVGGFRDSKPSTASSTGYLR
jgi:hypothetical protein